MSAIPDASMADPAAPGWASGAAAPGSATPDARPKSVRARTWRRALLIAAVIVGLIVLIGPRGRPGPPLDPNSTGPAGTRGIIDVLDRLGVSTRVADGAPTATDGVALVVSDDLSDAQRDQVRDWVADGGRLVLADPLSPLAPTILAGTGIAFTEPTIEPSCDDPLVEGVGRVAVAGGFVFDLPDDATGCFQRNDGYWMVRQPLDQGEVIVLGGPVSLTNDLLGTEDTAVLLVNLLTPVAGHDLHVVRPDADAAQRESLVDLLPDQVTLALLQLLLVWAALVWWRARRHGKPVQEVTPIKIEAAETTMAVGNLLNRAGRSVDAAAIMRVRVHRELGQRLGIPPTDSAETFVAIAAERTDIGVAILRRLLVEPLPTDDTTLIAYANLAAHTVDNIRQATHL